MATKAQKLLKRISTHKRADLQGEIKMRTKTNERKRYSLRVPKKRAIPIEDEIKSNFPKLKKQKEGENTKTKNDTSIQQPADQLKQLQQIQKQKPVLKTQKTKRKGKPSKSAAKEEPEISLTNEKEKSQHQQKPTSSTSDLSIQPQDEQTTTTDNQEEFPVYTALYHATVCQEEKTCTFPKCSIAKQFLAHCESCPKKEDCTICKAMDIMVCKHAENCETPLEKCCPIPNCDRVRYMVLEEWVKLKHRHHDIMTQVFQGLIHAWKCRDQSCSSVLCKNIKTVLLHTHTCEKDENSCRTKKFIMQLCQYHQQTCHNQQCDVEFCAENRRLKQQNKYCTKQREPDESQKQKDNLSNPVAEEENKEDVYSLGSTKPISNFGVNNLYLPNGIPAAANSIPTVNSIPAAIPATWNMNFNQQVNMNPGNFFYPDNQMAYTFPYMAWPPYNQAAFAANTFQQPDQPTNGDEIIEGENKDVETEWPSNSVVAGDNSVVDDTLEHPSTSLPASQEQTNPNEFQTNPNEFQSLQQQLNECDRNNNNCSSPTAEMYYQLWPTTKEGNTSKATLPRLSPNELQTILMTRGENAQLLSPVRNNRALFSEPPPLFNDYQNSQESELDENPIAIDHHQHRTGGGFESIVDAEKRLEEMEKNLKDQESWSKIDFVKEEKIQRGLDVATETTDETENESFSENNFPNTQDEGYFIAQDNGQTVDDNNNEVSTTITRRRMENIQLTSLERNYLAVLHEQKQG